MLKKNIFLNFAAFFLVCLCPFPHAAAQDLEKIFKTSIDSWHDGRPDDSIGSLKYISFISSDTKLLYPSLMNLAVLLAEAGKPEEALAYLTKAEIISPDDPYIHFEKGWNLFSLEKYPEARNSFEKVIDLTASRDLAAHARFAMALAETRLSGPAKAADDFRSVYQLYPHLIPPAAYMISRSYEDLKKRQHSITFLKETLEFDHRNLQAEIELARLFDEVKYYVPAWQTYYTLSEIDPSEPFFSKKADKLIKSIKGKPDNLLYWTRISWPVHNKPVSYQEGNTIDMALYADKTGLPSLVKKLDFICNSDFTVIDSRLGQVAQGKANLQWNVAYNSMNRTYEIKNNLSSMVHSTRHGFRITPSVRGGIILIKSPQIDAKGVNKSDKEITGELAFLEAPEGFILVNKTTIENCLAAMVASAAGRDAAKEALKALSVILRTAAVRIKRSPHHKDRHFNFCDSEHCLNFPGLQAENQAAQNAVADTANEVLYKGAELADVELQTACGGISENGINDGSIHPKNMTPFEFYKWTLNFPQTNLLCLPHDKTYASSAYWTLILEPVWMENRAIRKYKTGRLKNLAPLKRTKYGRILSMRIEGTASSKTIEGSEEISDILAAGTLRSCLFSIRPVFRGKYPEFFILRGIGTGKGRGYCLFGGDGMAKNYGTKYVEILKHYFPDLTIKKIK
ncbi:MAG: tetratricopeptide repeat protein [Elusimicrobia bacterium]|nr:tetratricopeptide repeat protein [Elusimicrobiota bacterium]